MYEKLCALTGLSATKDHCGKVITQLMNGTSTDAYLYASNLVYSLKTDFPEYTEYNTVNKDISRRNSVSFSMSNNSYIHNNNYNNTLLYSKQYYSKYKNWKNENNTQAPVNYDISLLGYLINILKEKGCSNFLEFCK